MAATLRRATFSILFGLKKVVKNAGPKYLVHESS